MPLAETIANSNEEIARGRLWRAREILASSIPNYGYQPELFLALAEVLMLMGDDVQAGKYYFLVVNEPDSRQGKAIELYLARHRQQGYQGLLKSFPREARLPELAQYPGFARQTLASLDAPESLAPPTRSFDTTAVGRDYFFWLGCLPIIFLSLACFTVGFLQLSYWLIEMLFGG